MRILKNYEKGNELDASLLLSERLNDSFIRVLLPHRSVTVYYLIAYIDRQPSSFSSASTSTTLYNRMGHTSIYLRRESIYVCVWNQEFLFLALPNEARMNESNRRMYVPSAIKQMDPSFFVLSYHMIYVSLYFPSNLEIIVHFVEDKRK